MKTFYNNDAVITVNKTVPVDEFSGYRATAMKQLKAGTVAELRERLAKKDLRDFASWVLGIAIANGYITLKTGKVKAAKKTTAPAAEAVAA